MRVLRRKRLEHLEGIVTRNGLAEKIELYASLIMEDGGFNILLNGDGAEDGYLFEKAVSFEEARIVYRKLR